MGKQYRYTGAKLAGQPKMAEKNIDCNHRALTGAVRSAA
jgi:hypothetical protein